MQIKKANSDVDLKVYDGKIDPGDVDFNSGFSQRNSTPWVTNYCWATDRRSNNHDDIQGNDHYVGIMSKISRSKRFCIYYYYSTHRPLSSMHLVY